MQKILSGNLQTGAITFHYYRAYRKHHNVFLALIAIILGLLMTYGFTCGVNANAAWNQNASQIPPDPDEPLIITDLMVEAKVDQETVRPGGHLVYTLRYTNTTNTNIPDVVLNSTLSKGQTYDGNYTSSPNIPVAQFTWSGDSDTQYNLTWQIPALAAHQSGSIILATDVLTTPEPSVKIPIILVGHAAEIQSTTQTNVSKGSDDIVSMVVGPLLEISKIVSPSPVLPGHLLYYTITLQNVARQDSIQATNIVISDNLPEHSIFIEASAGGYLNTNSNKITWTDPGPLDPGASRAYSFQVRVLPDTKSGTGISNSRSEYRVRSAEIKLDAITGKNDAGVKVAPVLQKSSEAERMSGSTSLVYPSEEVTYTLTVFNPLSTTLQNVLVTDTLPGDPEPFVYLRPAYGSPGPSEISSEGRQLMWLLELPPWGSASRSFVVQIPRNTIIPANKTSATYSNALDATHPDAFFSSAKGLAPVKVEAPVTLSKIASTNHGQPGDTVFYTITLKNTGPYIVSGIRLTDTLEGGFHYLHTTTGPEPLLGYRWNPVVWNNITLNSGDSLDIAFAAEIEGHWLTTYYNNLDALSQDAYIPSRTRLTPVKVDSPLGINKSVDPIETYINENVNYTIDVTNHSTATWTLANVTDYLPTGFYQVGGTYGNPAVIYNSPPVPLPPDETWTGSFTAHIGADFGCSGLPKTVKNGSGNIKVDLIAPEEISAYNSTDLAPLRIVPNIWVDLVPYRQSVLPGDVFTYTLYLSNVSPYAANDSSLVLTLPAGLSYISTISGQQPSSSTTSQINWENVNIPAGSETVIQILIQISADASLGTKTPAFSGSSYGICFGKLGSGEHYLGEGKVTIVDRVITLYKKPITTKVPPLALVEYEIKITNKDAYPYYVQSLTDTLPSGFVYYSMKVGPEPALTEDSLVWNDIQLAGKQTLTWRVLIQSAKLYGNYVNNLDAYSPYTPIDPFASDQVSVQPLFDLNKTVGVDEIRQGGTVPYTITLVNLSTTAYSNIVITDTLPAGFTYYRMLPGYPTPVSLGPNQSQPVWNGIYVKANCGSSGCTQDLVFEAKVGQNVSPGVYFNQVIGESASGSIPGPITTAPVTVTEWTRPPLNGNEIFVPIIMK